MILVVGGTKGGSGKTLLVSNLTAMRAHAGLDVLLIDADEQGSAMDFTRQRHRRQGTADYTAMQTKDTDVAGQAQRMRAKYADILIDAGGRDTASQRAALAVADVFLVPFVPTSVDLWTAEIIVRLLAEARVVNPGLQAFTVLNKAFPRGPDNADAAARLRDCPDAWHYLDAPIGTRKAFSNAFGEGYAVTEYHPRDAKAAAEMQGLYRRLFSEGEAHGDHPETDPA